MKKIILTIFAMLSLTGCAANQIEEFTLTDGTEIRAVLVTSE